MREKINVNLESQEKINSAEKKFRIGQALSLGIFTLGISMIIGDYLPTITTLIKPLSITTTVFGFMGTLLTELMARQARRW